jgi:hypothetical protein
MGVQQMWTKQFLVGVLFSSLAGCGGVPDKFSMYPAALHESQNIDSEMAVVWSETLGPRA